MENIEYQPGKNGGRLQIGNPGNKGGGRPKDRVRSAALRGTQKAIEGLLNMLDSDANQRDDFKLTASEKIKIAQALGSLSIGTRHEVEQVVRDPEIVSKAVKIAESMGVDGQEFRERLMSELEGLQDWDGLELVEGGAE